MGKKEKQKPEKHVHFADGISGKNSEKIIKAKNGWNWSKCSLIFTSVIVIIKAVIYYKLYENFTNIPEMPELSLDEWWGQNNTRQLQDTSIRPFRIVFSDAMEYDIRERFEYYRQMKKMDTFQDAGWTYGVNSEAFAKFYSYWIFKYNFKERERFLNKFNHFKTNIQGLDIHYMHVKPNVEKDVKVLPLLLLHGWPGSFREFYEVIPLLTTPRPGQDFVFEVIVPSLPGYGYSQAAVRSGLSVTKVAIIMRNLMKRLGFNYFYVQGGDFGHLIGTSIATVFPTEVLGFHSNLPAALNKVTILAWVFGGIVPFFEKFVEEDYTDRLYPLKEKMEFYLEESGYLHMHATKPDTFGIAMTESPAGLAAYILEKFVLATSRQGKFTEDGGLEGKISKDQILDNIMIYWMTGTITTSMRLYAESLSNLKIENPVKEIPTEVPTWGLRLKHEILFTPEWLLKRKFPNLLGTTTLDHGGHFAALEKPLVFADDVLEAVRRFQEFHVNKNKQ